MLSSTFTQKKTFSSSSFAVTFKLFWTIYIYSCLFAASAFFKVTLPKWMPLAASDSYLYIGNDISVQQHLTPLLFYRIITPLAFKEVNLLRPKILKWAVGTLFAMSHIVICWYKLSVYLTFTWPIYKVETRPQWKLAIGVCHLQERFLGSLGERGTIQVQFIFR